MNHKFMYYELMVHDGIEGARLLNQEQLLGMEREGLVTSTFRRLDPARQEAVVAAILEEARDRGPTRMRLKEAAAVAGVSVGSLYQYFGNRQGVIDFTVTFVRRRLSGELRAYITELTELPLAEALQAWLDGRTSWAEEHAGMMRFYVSAAYEGDPALFESLVRPLAELMLDGVRAILTAARERGEVRADVDLEATARVAHALILAVTDGLLVDNLGAYFLVRVPSSSDRRTLEATLDLIVAGLRP